MKRSESKSKISSKRQGFVVVLSAPSGCGKTTIVNRLMTRHPDWVRSISVTTRPPRAGEAEGKDYQFVSSETFDSMKEAKEFLEWAEVFGNDYGTRQAVVEENVVKGKTVLLAIDVQGGRKVRQAIAGKIPAFSIFILPPSVAVLRERLKRRNTENPEEIEGRIRVAEEEIKAAREYDATVMNQDLGETVRKVEDLIRDFERKLGEVRKGGK